MKVPKHIYQCNHRIAVRIMSNVLQTMYLKESAEREDSLPTTKTCNAAYFGTSYELTRSTHMPDTELTKGSEQKHRCGIA